MKGNIATKQLTRASIIACLYVVLSLFTFGINGGAIQLRLSEGLTLLSLFYVEAIPALFIGCLLSNFICGLALIDVFFGAFITLFAGVFTFLIGKTLNKTIRKIFVGGLFPVIFNAVLLPLVWRACYKIEYAFILQVLFLLVSQSISVYALGAPVYFAIDKMRKKKISFLL